MPSARPGGAGIAGYGGRRLSCTPIYGTVRTNQQKHKRGRPTVLWRTRPIRRIHSTVALDRHFCTKEKQNHHPTLCQPLTMKDSTPCEPNDDFPEESRDKPPRQQ